MDITTELQPAGDTRAAGDSLLEALVIVARHRGIHLNQTQLRRDHQLGPVDPSPDQLLRIRPASQCELFAKPIDDDIDCTIADQVLGTV